MFHVLSMMIEEIEQHATMVLRVRILTAAVFASCLSMLNGDVPNEECSTAWAFLPTAKTGGRWDVVSWFEAGIVQI